jgi:radical SAM protein with 4Fe4S-binding SPASM domain
MHEGDFDYDKYVENYVVAYNYAKELDVFYGSFLGCNFDGSTNYHCRACTPAPHLTPDGFLSACDMVTFGEKACHMDCFVYGKWDSDNKSFIFDKDKIQKLRSRSTLNMSHCAKCSISEKCGGYCLGEVNNETGSIYGQKTNACKAIRKLYGLLHEPHVKYEYLHP